MESGLFKVLLDEGEPKSNDQYSFKSREFLTHPVTGVLLRIGRFFTYLRTEQREPCEDGSRGQRDAATAKKTKDCRVPPEARRGVAGFFPWSFWREHCAANSLILDPQLRELRGSTTVILSHPVCGSLLQQTQERNLQWDTSQEEKKKNEQRYTKHGYTLKKQ